MVSSQHCSNVTSSNSHVHSSGLKHHEFQTALLKAATTLNKPPDVVNPVVNKRLLEKKQPDTMIRELKSKLKQKFPTGTLNSTNTAVQAPPPLTPPPELQLANKAHDELPKAATARGHPPRQVGPVERRLQGFGRVRGWCFGAW